MISQLVRILVVAFLVGVWTLACGSEVRDVSDASGDSSQGSGGSSGTGADSGTLADRSRRDAASDAPLRWAGCRTDGGRNANDAGGAALTPSDSGLQCDCPEGGYGCPIHLSTGDICPGERLLCDCEEGGCPLPCSPFLGCITLDQIPWECASTLASARLIPEYGLVMIAERSSRNPGVENFYDVCTGELVGWIGQGTGTYSDGGAPVGTYPDSCRGVVVWGSSDPNDLSSTCGPCPCEQTADLPPCGCDLAEAVLAWRAGFVSAP